MQQFPLLHTFPPAAIDVTAMDAEHVVDADEEERVARGGGGNRAGGYRHQGKGKGDKVETNMRCDYCNHMIEGKPYRTYSLGSGIGMHLNCAYYCWDLYDDVIPVFDIPVYYEVVLASMHPDYEPASSASSASTNNARCIVTAVQQHDGEAARAVRTLSALNLEETPEQQRKRRRWRRELLSS